MTAKIIPLRKPVVKPHEQAAIEIVDSMRHQMYTFSSDKARMEFCLVVIAQLILWICASKYYDSPRSVILSWVTKKCNDYLTKSESNVK